VVIWCQLRGWPKDVQRTVFQPVIIATSAMTRPGWVRAARSPRYGEAVPARLADAAGRHVGRNETLRRLDEASFRKSS